MAECDEPGASISGVALAHGLNTNLVRQWRAGRGVKLAGMTVTAPALRKAPQSTEGTAPPPHAAGLEFVAIEMPVRIKAATGTLPDSADPTPSPAADLHIHVELRRGALHLNVRWPTSASDDCTAWLREVSLGLLK